VSNVRNNVGLLDTVRTLALQIGRSCPLKELHRKNKHGNCWIKKIYFLLTFFTMAILVHFFIPCWSIKPCSRSSLSPPLSSGHAASPLLPPALAPFRLPAPPPSSIPLLRLLRYPLLVARPLPRLLRPPDGPRRHPPAPPHRFAPPPAPLF
jgi:hypothetical protein